MSFVAAASAARRLAQKEFVRKASPATLQRRAMGGGGHAKVEYEGIDKIVRGYFPEDYQLVLAILGGYTGLYVLIKLKSALSGGSKKEEPAPAVSSSSYTADASTGIPPVDTPEFDKYLETDAFYKMLENEEQLGKVVEEMK